MSASHRSRPGRPARSPAAAPDDGAGPGRRPRKRTAVLAAVAGAVLVLDVVSKVIVVAQLLGRPPVELPGGYLWLTHARNSGAAFSFAQGATVLFTGVAAVVIVVIARTAARLRSAWWAVSLGLVLGGAAGNLVDRLFRSPGPLRGHVVDWISLRTPDGKMLFPIFNLADSGIVCGGILAVLLAVLGYEMDGTRSGTTRTPATPPGPPAASRPPGASTPPAAGPIPPTAGTPHPGPAGPPHERRATGPQPPRPPSYGPPGGDVPSTRPVVDPRRAPGMQP